MRKNPWKRIAFRLLSSRWTVVRLSVIRSAFVFALFLAWLLPCSFARAADSFEDDSFGPRVEFDSETLKAVTNLARSVSGVNATPATVEDNVAAILTILQTAFLQQRYAFRTVPFVGHETGSWAIGSGIMQGLSEDWTQTHLSRETSFLYELQRSIYGRSGIPSQSQSLLPVLWRMESALVASTNCPPQDLSWTNSLATINESINDAYGVLMSIESILDPDMSEALLSLSGMIQDTFESSAENASSSDPALRVVDPVLESLLDQISQTLGSIASDVGDLGDSSGSNGGYLSTISDDLSDLSIDVSAIEDWTRAIHFDDLNYSGTDRSVQDDFLFLQKQIGVWNPSPTNNLYHLLSRLFDDAKSRAIVAATGAVVDAEIASAERSADDATTAATNVVSRTAEEEPDWDEHKYTADNPLDTGDSIFALPAQQARALLPTLPESTHKEIVLFRGNFPLMGGSVPSGSRSSNGVLLDISYPLTDFDDVSNGMSIMRDIMEWVWELCSCVLCVSMLFRFYASLATDKLKMESEAAMGV